MNSFPLIRYTTQWKSIAFALIGAFTLLPSLAFSQDAVWTQFWDIQSQVGPSSQTASNPPTDREVADDFEVVGSVQSIKAQGEIITYFNGPQMNLQSAWVRFYEWSNGVPGALQYERQIPASAITVTTDQVGMFTMQIPLPTQFTASGRHFVSVQTVSDLGWYWRTANSGNVRIAPAKVRERPAGNWTNANGSDVAYTLTGTLTGPPQLQSLSEASVTRSGRLFLFGANFGPSAANGEVRIGGQRAIVTSWSNTEIHAYVPEALTPGSYDVQVITNTGSSSTLPLAVTNRTSPGGHALWRFRADSSMVSTDPVVGPDGTIYVMDDNGNLYALTPDGGLIWATKSGFQGSRLTRGFDGTLYTLADGILRATNPDGTHKWDFGPANWTISGPTVGPDGNVYGTTQLGPVGFFSVTPEGQLRWSNPSIVDRIPRGFEIVFSEGQAYINHRINPQAGTWLMAFRMTDGALQWQQPADNDSQPLIGPNGRIYVDWQLGVYYHRIYNPDGGLFSQIQIGLGSRRFNPDKTKLYATFPSPAFISALDPISLSTIWSFDTGTSVNSAPTPDPFDRFVAARAGISGAPGSLIVLTSDGEFVWRDDLPTENGANIILTSGPVFSPNGNAAYAGTALPAYDPLEYSYVYAFQIASSSGPVPTSAVSRKIHGAAGAFDVALPLTGSPGVESRSGGANGDYQVIVSFSQPVTIEAASTAKGGASVASYSAGGSQITINLTGITTSQQVMITLDGVTDRNGTTSVQIPMNVLVGDANGNNHVNATDIAQTRAQSGAAVTAANFRCDVNASGSINASDVAQVKANAGATLP